MDNCALAQRLEIARRVKRESCGVREVTDEDLAEADLPQMSAEISSSISSPMTYKSQNNGIIGVRVRSDRVAVSFVAQIRAGQQSIKRSFDCAISAMQLRNELAEQLYPGIDAFKCDEDAVWERWGCSCGVHERGK